MQVAEALPEFAEAFPFESFNEMQREALPALLESEDNVVASAPTASGKTALAELAICRALKDGGTALFIAPMRALTNEKEGEWERFEELGYSVYVVTGERDLNPRRARRADILVMTPEKADSATRKHDSRRYDFVTDIDCCVIDEVHLLDSDRRGSVLEVTVSRLRRLCAPRIVALSATMPNIEDVADWLDAGPETTFAFGEEYRPVDLHADVKTYSHGENSFADKYRRLYRALDLAEPHIREDGQALVFVASRQDTVQAAKKARDELVERDIPVGARGDYDFHTETQRLENNTLRQSALDGVGFHHAGLSKNDRDLIEGWFKSGEIQLLFSTSTLAWGVNLPARCVVIRDTKYHDPLEGELDMSPLDVLQMLGRAGRPGYDSVGYGWVICDRAEADRYRRLLREGKEIESRLAEDLDSHLNAEIAMGTVRDLEDVLGWLETTFYYVRARSEPAEYGFETLRERVRDTLDSLVEQGFVEVSEDLSVETTPLGVLASKYYLRLETAARFHDLATREEVADEAILRTVARASEFDSVSARQSEREAIDAALGGRGSDLDAGERKVLAVLRGAMTGTTPSELSGDAWVIRRNALRLLAAFHAFCDRFSTPRTTNRVCRIEGRVEYGVSDDAVSLTAVSGIGPGRASKLASEGLTSPGDVRAADNEGLVEAGLTESVAERVVENAGSLPAVSIDWGAFPETIETGENEMCEVTVESTAGGANAAVRVTVNGVEMTESETFLGSTTVPVGVFGGDAEELTYIVEVVFPDLPLAPVVESRSVRVT
ncbi:DEAD/DEAH box helicase [Halalkalicoccus jeotgali]|uniref:DEAD/DEAH box helicase domain protein n=1 Tax=Halalkalicoccus jeotgali (strain DSM 18796 / CECT 7217 / JCM 14584 / KCTC 4019 / B3) TaxID=795797 RepID=D8J3S3_HALJB|nr:DEAD/DEAH box helicase [Halalkalicoccus jeotgali]ADJ13414.1 DEAD/DEAH box helicase domain protein [Halalkalicoccus jeotgali B3]ELY32754.1 DEAD/DEAH box helicase domain-containing protein [Halalkalicoccus jeotgali B3]